MAMGLGGSKLSTPSIWQSRAHYPIHCSLVQERNKARYNDCGWYLDHKTTQLLITTESRLISFLLLYVLSHISYQPFCLFRYSYMWNILQASPLWRGSVCVLVADRAICPPAAVTRHQSPAIPASGPCVTIPRADTARCRLTGYSVLRRYHGMIKLSCFTVRGHQPGTGGYIHIFVPPTIIYNQWIYNIYEISREIPTLNTLNLEVSWESHSTPAPVSRRTILTSSLF